MQNADSTVTSPKPSVHAPKRKRSLSNSYLQGGGRSKKVTRELTQDFLQDDDVEMDDADCSSQTSIEGAIRVNGGASSVAGAAAIAAATKALSDSEEWQNTIERIVKSVVSIRFCQVSFALSNQSLILGFTI